MTTSLVHRQQKKGASMEKEAMKVEVGQRWRTSMECVVREVTANGRAICHWANGDITDPSCFAIQAVGKFVGWEPGYGPQPPATAEKCDCYRTTCPSEPHQCGACGKMCPGRKQSTIVVNAPVPQVAAAQESVMPSGYARVGNVSALEAIRSRKPPELWRPSVDEWDLLPDA